MAAAMFGTLEPTPTDLEQLVGLESTENSEQDAAVESRSRWTRPFALLSGAALVACVALLTLSSTRPLAHGNVAETQMLNADARVEVVQFDLSTCKNDGDGKLTYEKIGMLDGKELDLILTAADGKEWHTLHPHQDGITDFGMGAINVESAKVSGFKATFVDADSGDAVKVPHFFFSLYDIDSSKTGAEIITVFKPASFKTSEDSDEYYKAEKKGDDVVVESTKLGKGSDNPTSLDDLTDQQRGKSMAFEFKDVDSFLFDVDLKKFNKNNGRNLMFSLKNVQQRCLPTKDVVEFKIATAEPDGDVVTYPKVGKVDGEEVDFKIRARKEDSWQYFKNANGMAGKGLGKVSAKTGYLAKLRAGFYKSGTDHPVRVADWSMTVYDIDNHGNAHEIYRFYDVASYSTENPRFQVFTSPGTVEAESSVRLPDKNNPTGTEEFTKEQREVSMTLVYKDRAEVDFDFDLSHMKKNDGRNMMFALLKTINTCAAPALDDPKAKS